MLENSEKTHKWKDPVKIFFLNSASCLMLAKAPETSTGFSFPSSCDNDKTCICFLCHYILLAIKKSMTFFHILCCLKDSAAVISLKLYSFLFVWYPIYGLILVNFIVANWDANFWFTFVFCQEKKWYMHLHADVHTSEKLFLFFILNLWGGFKKCFLFYFAV